jgi:tetratricopeptide (TPR) repeat protein
MVATLVNMAITHRRLKEYEKAASLLREAVQAARESRNRSMESFALLNLGNVAKERNRLDEALDYYRASLDIEIDLKQNNEIAYRLDSIAEMYWRKGLNVDALVYLHESEARLEGIAETSETSFHLSVLGQVQRARGQYEDAIRAFLMAIPGLEQTGGLNGLASTRCALADIYVTQGRFREALQVIEDGMAYYQNQSDTTLRVCYADFLIEVGDYPGAEEQLNSVHRNDNARELESNAYFEYVRGRLLAATRSRTAKTQLAQAVNEAAIEHDPLLSGVASIALGRILIDQGMVEHGSELLRATLEEARKAGLRSVQASAALVLAETELAAGSAPTAEELLAEAKALAESFQGRLLLHRVTEALSSLARDRGDTIVAERANKEARELFALLLDQLPAQHARTFQSVRQAF